MKIDRVGFVTNYGGNGLRFEVNGEDRPRIQDVDDGEFMIHHSQGSTIIHKKDIDDLIILLKKVKAHGYKIDY
jgi:hypothetical protein